MIPDRLPDDPQNLPGDPSTTQRRRMVADQLSARGIRAARVLAALERIPREQFLPPSVGLRAYEDRAQPIDCQQTISQPYMVARMTELLELSGTERVLEVGTGSGYQTAVLATLCAHVYTVEWYLKLLHQAVFRLEQLGLLNVTYRCGDGSLGWPQQAPYDAILCTAGAPALPDALVNQLGPGGRLVAPIGPAYEQELIRVRHTANGLVRDTLFHCRFVKLRGAAGWQDGSPGS